VTFPHEGPINGKRRVALTGEEVASKTHVGKHKTEKKTPILENDTTETMNILRGKKSLK